MSLAVAFLQDYFARGETTQASFAAACGINESHVSKLLRGEIRISGLNLEKLLAGLPIEHDKLSLIAAYLRDQIPTDHAHQIRVELADDGSESSMVEEHAPGDARAALSDAALASVLKLLPDATRDQLFHFAVALRRDADLQEMFRAVMRYVPRETARPTRTNPIVGDAKADLAARDAAANKKKAGRGNG